MGLCYDEVGRIVLDPDDEVRGAVELVFRLFRETGTAYAVVQRFAQQALRFPKRAYGGVWDGRLVWGRLTHERVLGILKNPAYAGTYVFGRYQYRRSLSPTGEIHTRIEAVPREQWQVVLQGHHEGYIAWDEYLANQERVARNRTHTEDGVLSGPAREGLALLQGLLVCGQCGRRLSVRYRGNGGLYPTYECNWRRREGLATRACLAVRCERLDAAVAEQVLAALQGTELQLALGALEEFEVRDAALLRQWRMRLARAEYEAQLAERRYQEVDPANRLVAATLERRWNEALQQLSALEQQFEQAQRQQARAATAEQKARILALAQDFPRLWHAPTTAAKDRKRMLRLLIKDITVEKPAPKQVLLHIRWAGGAYTDITVVLPPDMADQVRYPAQLVEHIRELAATFTDTQIADALNGEGRTSPKGKAFTASMIQWVRYKHAITRPRRQHPDELSVDQMMARFGVSRHVVYYWIERGHVQARQSKPGTPYAIRLDAATASALSEWVRNSTRISTARHSKTP